MENTFKTDTSKDYPHKKEDPTDKVSILNYFSKTTDKVFSRFELMTPTRTDYNSPMSNGYKTQSSFRDKLSNYNDSLVFDRLIADTNRRSERDMKILEFNKLVESKSIPVFSEKDEVYGRLLKDTEVRKVKLGIREQLKKKLEENEVLKYKSDKKITENQASQIVNRLISKSRTQQVIQTANVQDFAQTRDIERIKKNFKNETNKKESRPTKLDTDKKFSLHNRSESAKSSDLVEKIELEKFYGEPGKPKYPDETLTATKPRKFRTLKSPFTRDKVIISSPQSLKSSPVKPNNKIKK
jgi:hypothetical protein